MIDRKTVVGLARRDEVTSRAIIIVGATPLRIVLAFRGEAVGGRMIWYSVLDIVPLLSMEASRLSRAFLGSFLWHVLLPKKLPRVLFCSLKRSLEGPFLCPNKCSKKLPKLFGGGFNVDPPT